MLINLARSFARLYGRSDKGYPDGSKSAGVPGEEGTCVSSSRPSSWRSVLLVSGAASAEEALDLYQGRATVTGTREETRAVGFAAAFEEVLAKVSGDARLIGDGRVAAMAGNAAEYVASYTYRDRMEGIPAHDDQGSYDRPHDLTVTFDKGKIDGALASLGLKPWTEARPPIVLFVGVRNGDVAFVLSADAEQGASMREALAAAAVRTGLPASVPSRSALDEAGLTLATLPAADPAMLDEIRDEGGRSRACRFAHVQRRGGGLDCRVAVCRSGPGLCVAAARGEF